MIDTRRWHPPLIVAFLLLLPLLAGIAVGLRWGAVEQEYYSTASQLIVTLFIAIAIEFFSGQSKAWEDELDKLALLTLIGVSWFGLFGCVRAMLDGGSAWTAGLAASGLTAASTLVLLMLVMRLRALGLTVPMFALVCLFVIPPVALLVLL